MENNWKGIIKMKLYALGETARDREREMFVKEAKK